MKKKLRVAALLVLSLAAQAARAQEPSGTQPPETEREAEAPTAPAEQAAPAATATVVEEELPEVLVGFGTSVSLSGEIGLATVTGGLDAGELGSESILFVPVGILQLHLPLYIGDLRLEPEIGWFRFRRELGEAPGFEGIEDGVLTASAFRLGIGVAYAWEPAKDTKAYVGPKVGLIVTSSELEGNVAGESLGAELDRTDLVVGLAIGGEGFVTERFSLGVEGQLNYIDFGDVEIDVPELELPGLGQSTSIVSTNGLVFGRVYF